MQIIREYASVSHLALFVHIMLYSYTIGLVPRSMSAAAILIDGSILEGGGQILRNSVSLSALLSKAVSIRNIRHHRTPSGLKNQHRTGAKMRTNVVVLHIISSTRQVCN